jgi:hypothetical protein
MNQVTYLPQSYLETLCNELGDGGSETFDAELRKIIYSHVPVEDQLGQPSLRLPISPLSIYTHHCHIQAIFTPSRLVRALRHSCHKLFH